MAPLIHSVIHAMVAVIHLKLERLVRCSAVALHPDDSFNRTFGVEHVQPHGHVLDPIVHDLHVFPGGGPVFSVSLWAGMADIAEIECIGGFGAFPENFQSTWVGGHVEVNICGSGRLCSRFPHGSDADVVDRRARNFRCSLRHGRRTAEQVMNRG